MKQRIGVVVCDTHRLSRNGLIRIITEEEGIDLLGECGRGEDAVRLVREHRADVLIIDMEVPDIGGLEVARRLGRGNELPRVILIGTHAEGPIPARALESGASGYLTRGCEPAEVVTAVRRASEGRRYVDAEVAQSMVIDKLNPASSAISTLTARELTVMVMVSNGFDRQDNLRAPVPEPQDGEYLPYANHAQARHVERCRAHPSVVSARTARTARERVDRRRAARNGAAGTTGANFAPVDQHGTVRGCPHLSSAVEQHPLGFRRSVLPSNPDPRSGCVSPVRPVRTRPLRRKGTQPEAACPRVISDLPEQLEPKTRALMSHADSVGRDGDAHGDGGAPAREQPDQGTSPPLQHPASRRQELSLHPRHDRRQVPAPELPSRRTAPERPLFRSVRERRGDSQYARSAPEAVSRAPVRGLVFREPLPALSAAPDRALHRSMCRPGRRGGIRRRRASRHHVSRGQERGDDSTSWCTAWNRHRGRWNSNSPRVTAIRLQICGGCRLGSTSPESGETWMSSRHAHAKASR